MTKQAEYIEMAPVRVDRTGLHPVETTLRLAFPVRTGRRLPRRFRALLSRLETADT